MPIKITGIGDDGYTSTGGDSGTMEVDGSLILGNADTDSITVNAEFLSSLIPDVDNNVDLGSGDKAWREICVGTRINLHSTGQFDTRLEWEEPTIQNETVTIPAMSGHVALEGNLPSLLAFGKNGALDAPQTNFELTTVNGSQNGMGWRMPMPGKVTHMSAQFDALSLTGASDKMKITLYLNGIEQGSYFMEVNISATGNNGGSIEFQTPLAFVQNDSIAVTMTTSGTGGGTLTTSELACLMRILN
jgi:hypothetical protein